MYTVHIDLSTILTDVGKVHTRLCTDLLCKNSRITVNIFHKPAQFNVVIDRRSAQLQASATPRHPRSVIDCRMSKCQAHCTVLAQPIITDKKLSQQFFSRLDFFPVIQEKNQTRKTNGPVTPKIFSASWRRRAEYSPVSMTSAEDARFSALRFHPASDPRSGLIPQRRNFRRVSWHVTSFSKNFKRNYMYVL